MKASLFEIWLVEPDPQHAQGIRGAFSVVAGDVVLHHFQEVEKARKQLDRCLEQGRQSELPTVLVLGLSDQNKPQFEFLNRLRQHEDLKRLPVFMMGDAERKEEVRAAYHKNASAYIAKPSSANAYEDLVQILWEFWEICEY